MNKQVKNILNKIYCIYNHLYYSDTQNIREKFRENVRTRKFFTFIFKFENIQKASEHLKKVTSFKGDFVTTQCFALTNLIHIMILLISRINSVTKDQKSVAWVYLKMVNSYLISKL